MRRNNAPPTRRLAQPGAQSGGGFSGRADQLAGERPGGWDGGALGDRVSHAGQFIGNRDLGTSGQQAGQHEGAFSAAWAAYNASSTTSRARTACLNSVASPTTLPMTLTALAGMILPGSLTGVSPKKMQNALPGGQ